MRSTSVKLQQESVGLLGHWSRICLKELDHLLSLSTPRNFNKLHLPLALNGPLFPSRIYCKYLKFIIKKIQDISWYTALPGLHRRLTIKELPSAHRLIAHGEVGRCFCSLNGNDRCNLSGSTFVSKNGKPSNNTKAQLWGKLNSSEKAEGATFTSSIVKSLSAFGSTQVS